MTDKEQLREALKSTAIVEVPIEIDLDNYITVFKAARAHLKLLDEINKMYKDPTPPTLEDAIENGGYNRALDEVKEIIE